MNNVVQFDNEKISKIANALKRSNEAISDSNQGVAFILDLIAEFQNETNAKIDKMSESIIAIQEKKNHVEQPRDGYVTQAGLGAQYTPSIGSQYIGILLRKVGLAKQFEGKTCAFRQHIESGLAKTILAHNNYPHDVWHIEKTINYIDKWLIKNNLLNAFTAVKTESGIKDFINNL